MKTVWKRTLSTALLTAMLCTAGTALAADLETQPAAEPETTASSGIIEPNSSVAISYASAKLVKSGSSWSIRFTCETRINVAKINVAGYTLYDETVDTDSYHSAGKTMANTRSFTGTIPLSGLKSGHKYHVKVTFSAVGSDNTTAVVSAESKTITA